MESHSHFNETMTVLCILDKSVIHMFYLKDMKSYCDAFSVTEKLEVTGQY
jgi:hypothetical protein